MSLARAIETGDLTELPSRRDEEWRWSDFRGLVRELPAAAPVYESAPPPSPFAGVADETIEIVNGRGPTGYVIGPGERRVLALQFVAADAGAHVSDFAIEAGTAAELILLESHQGEGVTQANVQIRIAPDAHVERIVLADQKHEAISVVEARVDLADRASFSQTVITTGARRQRLETRVRHPGGGAKAKLDGLYLIAERRHGDITTVVVHDGPDGKTEQIIRGVAADQGRGIFQGRIEVRPGGDRTDARMRHDALLLSERAEVDAKPELEIYADDVACSHGNSVGALDEEALFYALQRGIPEDAARAMLTEAFLGGVIERIRDDRARGVIRDFVATVSRRLA